MRFFRKVILPLGIILLSVFVAVLLVKLRPQPEKITPKRIEPAIEVIVVKPEVIQLWVRSQGTVEPRTETLLNAEVSGIVLEVSENFRTGGFFQEGELLVRIDDADYRAEFAARKAALSEQQLLLLEESALAEQARLDWEALGKGQATDLVLRKPQLAKAQAAVESAQAALVQAERNLQRTHVTAPYAGMVTENYVDVGQSVGGQSGAQLARIFAVDVAEIRLPVSITEMGSLELSDHSASSPRSALPKVSISPQYGQATYTWHGRITRTEAAVDRRTQLMYIVAEVLDPYAKLGRVAEQPLLRVGMFVNASVQGRRIDSGFRVPATAFVNNNTVLVVDADNKVYRRTVKVVQKDTDYAVVDGGLVAGERVVVSQLQYSVDGMRVQVIGQNVSTET